MVLVFWYGFWRRFVVSMSWHKMFQFALVERSSLRATDLTKFVSSSLLRTWLELFINLDHVVEVDFDAVQSCWLLLIRGLKRSGSRSRKRAAKLPTKVHIRRLNSAAPGRHTLTPACIAVFGRFTPHAWRHTAATTVVKLGGQGYEMWEALGVPYPQGRGLGGGGYAPLRIYVFFSFETASFAALWLVRNFLLEHACWITQLWCHIRWTDRHTGIHGNAQTYFPTGFGVQILKFILKSVHFPAIKMPVGPNTLVIHECESRGTVSQSQRWSRSRKLGTNMLLIPECQSWGPPRLPVAMVIAPVWRCARQLPVGDASFTGFTHRDVNWSLTWTVVVLRSTNRFEFLTLVS